jgi:hypothetical protein
MNTFKRLHTKREFLKEDFLMLEEQLRETRKDPFENVRDIQEQVSEAQKVIELWDKSAEGARYWKLRAEEAETSLEIMEHTGGFGI